MMQTNALSAMRAISSAKRACATRRDAPTRNAAAVDVDATTRNEPERAQD
jgi:hypothetical protein